MSSDTKHRQQQTAEICKQHLRQKYPDKLGLVGEFIVEFEGAGKTHDITRWTEFTDASRNNVEMLKRVDEHFDKWLNP